MLQRAAALKLMEELNSTLQVRQMLRNEIIASFCSDNFIASKMMLRFDNSKSGPKIGRASGI